MNIYKTRKLSIFILMMLSSMALVPNSQAEMLPRILYVTPDYDGKTRLDSFLGDYWYLGVAFTGSTGGFSGPSIRYGFGDTGDKVNISYLLGGPSMSLEAGISYIRQETNATLMVNDVGEGYAFEAALRFNIASVIVVATETDTAVEVAIGF